VTWLRRLQQQEDPPSLREQLVALCALDDAPARPGTVTVQVHFGGKGATDAFWRIVAEQAAWDSVHDFGDFLSAQWGDSEAAVGFSLYAADDPREGLHTRLVVVTDGGELP
jgi:hypothetical protein